MLINISTSKQNQAVVTKLTAKLTGSTKENVIARIALGYSLASGRRFTKQELGFMILKVRSIKITFFLILL